MRHTICISDFPRSDLSTAKGSNINPYDVRRTCDSAPDSDSKAPLCYRQMNWIETWMNNPATKTALGAKSDITFQACKQEIDDAFTWTMDPLQNAAGLLPELVDAGVRLLVYAGNAG